MNIQALHSDFIIPTLGTRDSGAFDLYMPEAGRIPEMNITPVRVPLGFASEVPKGYVALILPRSGAGSKHGVELQNTAGVIDADYRGQWFAFLNTKTGDEFTWEKGSRVLQFALVPVLTPELTLVDSVSSTDRGQGGFGSTDAKD